ncbi:threonine aldolase family protein [Tranquillimonas alkanivorans]|uniref:L-threonine aldolase n=1 Tax=Tranquillimonas alkanivorans TaxID=441119 RepID=A0A1I5NCG4_9RHOB|nr:low specificity L-threonine aldolase [Tranquillimonas alkanivorans]SFP19469.1 L-threonine aldolase [Tranquillimonas alkanivorans]
MYFASDNSSPAHPRVLEALTGVNNGYAMPYGADAIMDRVRDRIRDIFEAPEAAVYLVATGTSANALALATYCPPWAAVFCHRNAHIEEDECGAPEFYTGGSKLVLVEGEHAKMTPEALQATIEATGQTGVHNVQRGMVSITNTTENGTVYSATEVATLAEIAHAHGLPVHMDGARFANALVADGATPAEMTWKSGVDVLSFGGTKNGLLGVEAVVMFDPAKAWEFELRRKRGGHLFSKHRYLSAQMDAYLQDDLWLDMARSANAAAAKLSQGILSVEGASLLHPTDANIVFAGFPRAGHRAAQEAGAAYYLWPFEQPMEGPGGEALTARLVCSWSTTDEDVERFLDLIRG